MVFSTFPSKAEVNQAKKDKKTADQMPKDGMVIVDLASGRQTRIERVRRFAMPQKATVTWPICGKLPKAALRTRLKRRTGAIPPAISRLDVAAAAGEAERAAAAAHACNSEPTWCCAA